MFDQQKLSREKREKRALRVRKKLRGTAAKPRLSVFKSNKHLFAQLIDDETGKTLASVGTIKRDVKNTDLAKKSKTSAKQLGEMMADHAIKSNVLEVVFDRGPSKYHGLLAAFAEGAREKGLKF